MLMGRGAHMVRQALEMVNSAGQSSPARLVGRVGRASKKPGPAQLEP